MIVFGITMNAIPEKRLELTQTLLSLIDPTAREAGCQSFRVSSNIKDKNIFSLLGEWDTREELDRHIATDQFGVLLGTRALLSGPLNIRIYTIERSEGMGAILAIREEKKTGLSNLGKYDRDDE